VKIEPKADGTVNVRVGQYVPALVLVFEAEARAPRWFGDGDPEKVQRVIDGLSDEWRAVLTRALGALDDD
jgi:hypothetical protein